MQKDFHYYATYCAAVLAGYSHEESLQICTSAQFVDLCSRNLLVKLKAPLSAATTQLTMEMANARTESPESGPRSISCHTISGRKRKAVPGCTGINSA